MLKYIIASFIALVVFVATGESTPDVSTPVEVKRQIKLTTRHLPIHRYFVDEDEDEELYTANHAVIHRRNLLIKAQVDIGPTEDDVVITDGIRLRLMLARMKALDKYNEIHKVDKI